VIGPGHHVFAVPAPDQHRCAAGDLAQLRKLFLLGALAQRVDDNALPLGLGVGHRQPDMSAEMFGTKPEGMIVATAKIDLAPVGQGFHRGVEPRDALCEKARKPVPVSARPRHRVKQGAGRRGGIDQFAILEKKDRGLALGRKRRDEGPCGAASGQGRKDHQGRKGGGDRGHDDDASQQQRGNHVIPVLPCGGLCPLCAEFLQ